MCTYLIIMFFETMSGVGLAVRRHTGKRTDVRQTTMCQVLAESKVPSSPDGLFRQWFVEMVSGHGP